MEEKLFYQVVRRGKNRAITTGYGTRSVPTTLR